MSEVLTLLFQMSLIELTIAEVIRNIFFLVGFLGELRKDAFMFVVIFFFLLVLVIIEAYYRFSCKDLGFVL